MRTPGRFEDGSVIILSMSLVFLLGAIGSTALMRSVHEHQLGRRSESRQQAFFLAEAGVDRAIVSLRGNSTSNIPSTSFGGGSYSAELTPQAGTQYLIAAHGVFGTETRDVEAVVQRTPQSVFTYAMFGYDELEVKNGALTDSYNSSMGNYTPATAGSNGHIGTNSTGDHAVKLSNGGAINGKVFVGPGMADPTTAVDNTGGIITGTPPINSATQALGQPAISPPSPCATPLKVDHGASFPLTEALSPYCYTEIVVDNGATVSVTGNVTVYVTGKINVKNSAEVNVVMSGTIVTSKPTALIIQSNSTDQVLIDNSAKFVGAIYAPYAEADVKNSAVLYGAIVAKEVKEDNSAQVHYDEALASIGPTGSYDVEVLSWRED